MIVKASLLALALGAPALAQALPSETVGMRGLIRELLLPGSELEPVPQSDPAARVELRVAARHRHGQGYHYDLEFTGFEPGRFDLRPLLRRKDGGATGDLPEILVEIRPALPAGAREPNALEPGSLPRGRSYRWMAYGTGLLWLTGFLAIVLAGRRRRAPLVQPQARPLSLAERLRPLVQAASAGTLDASRRAELERLLLAHWRQHLRLEHLTAAEAMAELRAHAEAGPLLAQLDRWLHQPRTQAEVDLALLLAPYHDAPPSAATAPR